MPPAVLVAALALSILVGSTAAILSWRAIPRPGAQWLSVLLVGQVWWSISTLYRIQSPGIEGKLFWLVVMWIGVVLIPLAWILFTLEYSGRDQYITNETIGMLAVVPLLTILLVLTHSYHDLITITTSGYTDFGILRVEFGGAWYWVIAVYTYLMGIVGLVLVFELAADRGVLFRRQGIALGFGLVLPWLTNVLFVTGLLDFGFDPTPVAFAPSGVIYFLAIKRFQLLRANPAPTRQARRMVFNGVQEGALIVDMDDHVIEMNERAEEIFGTPRKTVIGAPGSDVFAEFDELPTRGTNEDYLTIQGETGARQFEVGVQPIASTPDNTIGRLVTINEVTGLLRQQQRLEVLHRVLRHNIRTETNLILGYAQAEEGEYTQKIRKSAETIEALGEKGREAIDLFSMARTETEPRKLATMLEGAIADVEREFPAVEVRYDAVGPGVMVDGLLEGVFRNAIENAAMHNEGEDQRVWIETSLEGEQVQVRVADNGPGIGDHELEVLEEGTETALSHGSGIGLWTITWGVDLAEGQVTFGERASGGTEVVFAVPVLAVDEK
ncbi:MAG: histidine kinase N-terminal 7TM domain-containing protein [Halodesulfurarchaeum sp.]|nr:histidine kinase N-terminal 7TM domain-containing protein [Halodesulfurarchaeum sp.]